MNQSQNLKHLRWRGPQHYYFFYSNYKNFFQSHDNFSFSKTSWWCLRRRLARRETVALKTSWRSTNISWIVTRFSQLTHFSPVFHLIRYKSFDLQWKSNLLPVNWFGIPNSYPKLPAFTSKNFTKKIFKIAPRGDSIFFNFLIIIWKLGGCKTLTFLCGKSFKISWNCNLHWFIQNFKNANQLNERSSQ